MKTPKVTLVIYASVLLLSMIVLFFTFPKSYITVNKYTVDANERFVSVTVKNSKGQFGIMIFDMHSKKWMHIFKDNLLTAMGKFSTVDPNSVYFSSYSPLPDYFDGTDLHRCDLQTLDCDYVFSMNGSLSSPIDFPDKSLLFVSSPVVWKGPEDRRSMRFTNKDFYLRSSEGRIQRLTHLEFQNLYSVSLSGANIVFDADGPHNLPNGNMRIPRDYEDRSEIYKSTFNRRTNDIPISAAIEKPFVRYGDFRDILPSTNSETSIIVFRSISRGVPKKHSLISYDANKKEFIDVMTLTEEDELSNPILINKNEIIFMTISNNEIKIHKRNIITKTSQVITKFTTEDMQLDKVNSLKY